MSCALLGLAGFGLPALAQPPSPIQSTLFAFPGHVASPASARSAALALGDRWLADDPFANPAAVTASQITLSPALVRVSRQDLRAGNRNYDETPAFIDGAGLSAGTRWGDLGLSLYAYQSALRLEDNAFELGPGAPQPAVITTHSELREARAGLAASHPLGPVRAGAGLEWTRRSDLYETTEASGGPESGSRHVDFDGGGFGAQLGVRFDHGDTALGGFSVGAAVRMLPALTLEGEQRFELAIGDSVAAISVDRDAGWEIGTSAAVWLSPAFRVIAGLGGHSEQAWEGFGVARGSGIEWSIGGEFHDARDPWTLRFGLGQSQQSDVPEPRAGVFGIGIGWVMEGTVLDFGAVRRSFKRLGEPTSYDDRFVASIGVRL
jgi:hypothetical protein